MRRIALVSVLLVFGALLIGLHGRAPQETGRLAALEAGALLGEPVVGRDPPLPLWRFLVGPLTAAGGGEIRLGSVRLELPGQDFDTPALRDAMRRSLARRLRAIAAGSEAMALPSLAGLRAAAPEGVDLSLRLAADRLTLRATRPDGLSASSTLDWVPPSERSLVPPLLVIFLAILLRRPVLALFAGVVIGSFLHQQALGGAGILEAAALGVRDVFTVYLWNELANNLRIEIVVFVASMLAFVGIITRAGGLQGLMDRIARIARNARRTQIASYLMGLAIFFDDYANTLLVGSTMRPLSDRFRIAREKLAYIVDSTAAPVAGLSIFSTWVAFEVSTYSAQLPSIGLSQADGFAVFLATLPYRFYCILTLCFVLFVVLSGRDFGPMRVAERRARAGKLLRDGAHPMLSEVATALEPAAGIEPRASVAVAPLLTFVLVTGLTGAWKHSGDAFARDGVFALLRGGSNSLMIGSLAALAVASGLALRAGLRWEIARSAFTVLRSAGVALLILYLAWMIGAVCDALGTAPYLTALLGESAPAWAIPAVLFLLSGGVAFATGSSWGTMSVLLPIVVGFAYAAGEHSPVGSFGLMVMSIGAVLEGSIFGDHCSPVSDTTILSSIAAASDHVDHVRTQIPYAILTMLTALSFGYLPCALFGLNPWLGLALGAAALWTALRILGTRADET
ncbi:MAG: Na+/H+ antiporter NhaC family protein [Myxococcales bacterium]|nr:Na+/H+ antiporter NhaC family protein [Myxococcales bacterium]